VRFTGAPGLTFLTSAAIALAGAVACGSSASDPGPPATPPAATAPDAICGDGFTPIEGGAGCAPVLPPAACAAGTRAAIGSATCAPVGVTVCAPGFVVAASGWGCDPVLPATACAIGSGTRERLGSATCAPVSDCNAPFPPPGSTMFVSAAYADAQIDATHFRTITDAVNAAAAGAIIAVDSGTYVEQVVLKHHAVSILGRCTDKVLMQQAPGVIGSAISAGSGDDLLLRNISFRGYNVAIGVLGGKIELDSLVIEDGLRAGLIAGNGGTAVHLTNVVIRGMTARAGAGEAFGIFASAGATVTVDDSVIAANEYVNIGVTKPGTTLHLTRSIVRDGKPLGPTRALGMGVYTAESGAVTIEESAILDNSAAGLDVFSTPGAGSAGTLRRSVVRGTKRDGAMNAARGVDITASHVVIEQSTIRSNVEIEIIAGQGAQLDLSDSTLVGADPIGATERGATGLIVDGSKAKLRSLAIVSPRAGVEIQGTASVDMSASLVTATRTAALFYESGRYTGPGMVVESKASLALSQSTIEGAHTAGLASSGHADITESLVRGTRAGQDGQFGRGISIQLGGVTTVTRSAVIDNVESGVFVSLSGASLTMTGSTVQGTGFDGDGNFGIGVLIGGDVNGTIEDSTITGSKGIGLAVASASAFVHHSIISRNAVGVHAQDGTTLAEGEEPGDARACVISKDTSFVENATRVGSGVVPLPMPLGP
jgi:hypothetical protein